MSMINYASREINCKLVYYGPGLGGKTTNLEHVYNKVAPASRGKMISLATETERTLFFDFLPVDLGTIRGFKVKFHLYTVPGQVYYNASRKLILKGVDGVVFVADSQIERMDANIEAMQNLYENMTQHGYDVTKIPFAIQYNKRDLPNAAPNAGSASRVGVSGPAGGWSVDRARALLRGRGVDWRGRIRHPQGHQQECRQDFGVGSGHVDPAQHHHAGPDLLYSDYCALAVH
jgi:signal recognition particle receptor subunit beta